MVTNNQSFLSIKRKSGIAKIGSISRGTSFCQFYLEDADLNEIVIPYFKAGLKNNEACIWVTANLKDLKKVRSLLEKNLPYFEKYSGSGQLQIVPLKTMVVAGTKTRLILDIEVNSAITKGFSSVRFTFGIYGGKNINRQITNLNEDLGKHNVVALFLYPQDKFDAIKLMDVVKTHQFALIRNNNHWEVIEGSEASQVKKALLRSELNYRSLFNNMLNGYAYCRMIYNDGRPEDFLYLAVNDAFEKLTGLKNVTGKMVTEVIPGINRSNPELFEIYGRVALTEQPEKFETYVNALKIWFSISVFSPESGSFVAVFENITERKKADEAIKESEERFKALSDTSPVGVAVSSSDGVLLYTNRSYRLILGYDHSELVGKKASDLYWNPAERHTLLNTVGEDGVARDVELKLRRKDGTPVWVSINASPISYSGRQAIMGTIQDITKRRIAEETLRTIGEREKILADATGLLLSTRTPETIVQDIAAKVMAHLNCDAFFNFLIEKGRLKLNAYAGIPQNTAAGIAWLNMGEAICGCVAQDGCRIVSEDVQSNGDVRASLVRSFGIQAYASHPLLSGNKTIGTLSFGTRSRTSFSEDELEFMKAVTDRVAIAMQRKQAEEALARSKDELEIKVQERTAQLVGERQRLYNVLETLPAMICLLTPDHHVAFANRSFRDKFGEAKGRYCYEYCFGSARPCDFCESFKVLETGKPQHWEVNAPDGSVIDAYDFPFTDVDGSTLILEMDIDITQRKRAEAELKDLNATLEQRVNQRTSELRETKDYLENLLNYANAPIIVWNSIFKITQFNHAFETLTGRKAHDVLGKKLDILFPDDSKEASMGYIRKAASGERWEVVEIPILRLDGEVRTVLWNSANIYDSNGKTAVATIAQGQDITERKRAEEALRSSLDYLDNLFNYANAPIIVWNPRFEITRFNHAFEQLTGRRAEEVLGKGLDILFPDNSRETSMNYIRKTVAERWEVKEISILRTDGSVRTVLWNSATLYASDGKTPTATIAQGQDITERKKAEEQLKQSNTELEASNKELEAFSYSVSHDLRAPLRSMEGFSSALIEDYAEKLDEQGKKYLRHVQESSELMGHLIDDLLKLSRVTRSEMNYEEVNLSELVKKIAAELAAAEPGRKIELKIAPNITANGDRNLLRLALNNLLGNAWKFSSKVASPRIEMGITERNGKRAYFIRDNGAGFDMAYVDKLFKPFQRLHAASMFPGTGIGLATVQRIVRRHGGEVWAESKPGEGATFYFMLS